MPTVLQAMPPTIHWLADENFGPRKQLLDLPGQFYEGDILRVERTGENMLVIREFPDAKVKRARGASRAQTIVKGDRIRWIGRV